MKAYADLHPIQEDIVKKLGYSDERSFSDIKGSVESNKFAFHLNKLQEKNLIKNTNQGYKLTGKGREILPYFDLEDVYHPVIVVNILVFAGEKVYLVPKREDPLDPFEGDYRALSSRVSKNDRVKQKAVDLFENEFNEKPLKLEEITVFDSQVSFEDGSHQHYLLFYFKAKLSEVKGENWFKLSELKQFDLLPGLNEVIKKTKSGQKSLMAQWDLVETEDGFKVKELDF